MKKKVVLSCEICNSKNYSENKSSLDVRLVKNKFCKKCGTHQLHKEEK